MESPASGNDAAWLQGLVPAPGNLACAEQLPQFCLLGCTNTSANSFGDPDQFADTASTASSRHLSISAASTSTSASDIDSCNCNCQTFSETQTKEASPSGTPTTARKRSRRNKEELHLARLRRSQRDKPSLGSRNGHKRARWTHPRTHSSKNDALAALEPPNERALAKMSTLEQQRWINVQQKTFTKWYVCVYVLGWPRKGLASGESRQPIAYAETLQVKHKISGQRTRGQGFGPRF